MSTPFTYLLVHLPTGRRYYGVRFKKGCSPTDLWTKYFSSSKVVKELIKRDGPAAFEYTIRRTFSTWEDALAWEKRVLKRLDVMNNPSWLNQHDGSSKFRSPIVQSERMRRIASETHKGKPKSEEWKAKMRERALIREKLRRETGWKMPEEDVKRRAELARGVKRSAETAMKIGKTKLGRKRLYAADGSFTMAYPTPYVDQ